MMGPSGSADFLAWWSAANVRFGSIVLKKSASNTSESIPRNNDSIATHILNHCCITKARHDRKLRAKHAFRLFQHNRPKADIRVGIEASMTK